jgi:CIC family chloride channel protein
MTGDYALTLPVMLAVAIASATSRALSYGTIYTTKLLRRGFDVDRAAPWRAFGDLKAADAMRPFAIPLNVPPYPDPDGSAPASGASQPDYVFYQGDPQAVYGSESLAQTLRQLEVYGRDGLPVLSADGQHVLGWITNASVLKAVAGKIKFRPGSAQEAVPTPLDGYRVLEINVSPDSPAAGEALGNVSWPEGSIPVSVLRDRRLSDPDPGITLEPGDRVSLLTPALALTNGEAPGRSGQQA